MKTTNFEISKQLKEVGFNADFTYCYSRDDKKEGIVNFKGR